MFISNIMGSKKQILLESLRREGFSGEILRSFSKVERKNFIPKDLKEQAYDDTALSLGFEQTISQPYTIAMMLSLLELKENQTVLEIGSGCGYVLSLLSEIVGKKGNVFGIEIIKDLFEKSEKNLKEYNNIKIYNKNGRFGLKEKASFDRIIISAASDKIPQPLIAQLKDKGIIVAPIISGFSTSLISFEKIKGKLKIKQEIPGFVFVPLIESN